MKKNIFLLVILFISIFIISCSSDSSDDMEPIPDPDPTEVTYTNTVKGIMTTNCSTSLCHDSSSPTGNLSLTTYAQVKSAFQNNGALAQIESGNMPYQTTDLSTTTINKIKAWIANNYEE